LMGALLVAASIPKWKEQLNQLRPRDFAIGLAFALSLIFIGTQIIWDCEYIGRAKFETLAHDVRGAVSFKDYLPVWAHEFSMVENMKERVDSGSRQVTIKTWEPEHRSFHVDAGSEMNLRLRTYFYPHWTARAEGRVLPTSATSDGLLQVSAPGRAIDIDVTFERPAWTRVFEIIAVFSWVLIVGAFVCRMIEIRRSSASDNDVQSTAFSWAHRRSDSMSD
jgi:hypothetical protein